MSDEGKPQRFEGDFLESADLMHSDPVRVKIAKVIPPNTEKAADGRLIDRPIIEFHKAHKRFILSKTNVRLMKSLFGPTPAEWVDKEVTLGVRYLKTAFGEKNVPTVRVIVPDGSPMPFGARKHYGSPTPFRS